MLHVARAWRGRCVVARLGAGKFDGKLAQTWKPSVPPCLVGPVTRRGRNGGVVGSSAQCHE